MTPKIRDRWLWLAGLIGCVVVLAGVGLGEPTAVTHLFKPITNTDINQHRANVVLPAPNRTGQIRQTFTPRHDNLMAVELLLARANNEALSSNGRLHVQLLDDQNQLVATQTLGTQFITHNQSYTLQFPPQPNSNGRSYTLLIGGSDDNDVSLWGYDLDVHRDGRLQLIDDVGTAVATTAQDLRFITQYQLGVRQALGLLLALISQQGGFLLLTLFFLPLPGELALLLARRWGLPRLDFAAWWGTAVALGVALWPLLWLGLTLVNGRFTGWLLWFLLVTGWLGVGILLGCKRHDWPFHRPAPVHALLLVILLVGLTVRLLAVRDISFPPWVDAGRHALITAVMVGKGQTPTNYYPYLPIDTFPYHFGFHTLSTSLILLTGKALNEALLYLGQLLNALVPLTMYAAVWMMTRRRNASLIAAFLVALPFFFPAYYATWGRMTQLTAVLIFPVLLAFTWQLLRGGKGWQISWGLVGILAAGLLIVHIRVFIFYLPFVPLVGLVSFGRNGRYLLAAVGFALLLSAPQVLYLINVTEPVQTIQTTLPNYNTFPSNYVTVGWEQQMLVVAALGVLLVVVGGVLGKTWATLPLVLIGWVSSIFLLLAGERLGLPETSVVNLNSYYITAFIPLGIFLGVVGDQVWRSLQRRHWLADLLLYGGMGGLVTAVGLFGIRQQIAILNDQTLLVQNDDLPALQWVAENLPADAVVAHGSWLWLGGTWAGSDGGAWLLPFTGRLSSTPPADYLYNRDLFRQVNQFNEVATAVTDWSDPIQADWLRQQAMTHIFIGARGGYFEPSALSRNPGLQLLYAQNGTFIFQINPPATSDQPPVND